jgi:hypothetical protein
VPTISCEIRGSTVEPGGKIPEHIITRENQPDDFHNAMVTYWAKSMWFSIAGFVLLLVDRTLERSNPLSPDFGNNQSKEQTHTDGDSST